MNNQLACSVHIVCAYALNLMNLHNYGDTFQWHRCIDNKRYSIANLSDGSPVNSICLSVINSIVLAFHRGLY